MGKVIFDPILGEIKTDDSKGAVEIVQEIKQEVHETLVKIEEYIKEGLPTEMSEEEILSILNGEE